MKNRIYLLTGTLCIIMQLAGSCSNFLEVEEKGKTTIPSFLSDPDGLNAGLVGAHIIRCMLIMTMSIQNTRMLPEICCQ